MKAPTKKTGTRPEALGARLPGWRRASAYVFVSCLGIWIPRIHGAILVDLDATQLAEGPLQTWTNRGAVTGNFTSAGTVVPQVTTVLGTKGVSFQGLTGGGAGTHYLGPAAPEAVTGFNSRTIEAWIDRKSVV